MASQALSSSATAVRPAVTVSPWKPQAGHRTWWQSSSPCKSRTGRLSFSVGSVRCKAVGQNNRRSFDNSVVYQGLYGPWTVDKSDIREVILYRSGLVIAASSFVLAASAAFLPDDSLLSSTIKQNHDYLYVAGSCGLGLSLLLIHIYVSEIKRTLQALWVLGILGSCATYIAVAQPANQSLIHCILDNPSTVWLVGPLFAALTGLVFKEGLCYGKLEAGLLTFVIPTVLLGHLTGLMDNEVKLALLAAWMVLFVIFAGRKFTQPVKDDIGDKSVFMFNSLPDDDKAALLEKLEQQKIK
ncbi:uncharacterized protein LOC114756181 [Neltuma alba]|uniref:uncharacterized protein LOC114756181 n=1 Tax=Neltuma alba TaxID=207710 RepID=UPI0010A4C2FE|nr:uncharacterized protein LOC114756181 [Prosopis alba]